jgi:hypothetical protein
VDRGSDTACSFFRLALECRDAGQADTQSFGANGIWALLGRPPERAREQCACRGYHYLAVSVGAACGVYTIAQDERFRHLQTRWTFWVVSNDLDPFAMMRTRQKGKPRGQVTQTEVGSVEVWVKTWSEILEECKARMRFVQEHLQANVDKEASLKYLKATYEKYLTGIEVETDAA